jgi:hypothetical protein
MPNFSFGRFAAPAPTSYHLAIGHLLERRYPELWERFASRELRATATADIGLALARRAAPLGLLDAPQLYEAAGEISRAMGLEAPIRLYQGDPSAGLKRNAALYFDPEHVHIVFEGDLLERLEPAAFWYVIGHELAHHRLWTAENGRIWTAHRLLCWAADACDSAAAFQTTARNEKLYTEIFADRYGLWASGDLDAALNAHAMIISTEADVSGAAYLAASEQALAECAANRDDIERVPEGIVRAALLAEWARHPSASEARARTLIEGRSPIERLDLLSQERLADITHWMLYEFLGDPWRRRELIQAHAALISETLAEAIMRPRSDLDSDADLDPLHAAISNAHNSVQRYLAYLLLDFTTVDPQIEDLILVAALQFAHDFGLGPVFRTIASQELKITKTKLDQRERNADEILARADLILGDAAKTEPSPTDPHPGETPVVTPQAMGAGR